MSGIDTSMSMARFSADALRQENALEVGLRPRDVAEIKKAAEEFESIFMELMLKSMRDTVPKDGIMNGGNAEDVYRSMLDSEYAKVMAQQQSTGLAETITRQLLQTMQKQAGNPANLAGHQAYRAQAASAALQEGPKQATMEGKTR